MSNEPRIEDNPGGLVFDATIYSADALQRAAYRMSDRIAVHIAPDGCDLRCKLTALDGSEAPASDVASFRVHATDYSLRERIRAQTEATRNVILALAFSGLQDPGVD